MISHFLWRLWADVRVAATFFLAIRKSSHARYADRVADAGAMILTRALRSTHPDAPFPFVVSLNAGHARDVGSTPG